MECGCVCECDVRQPSTCHVLFVKPLKWMLFCIFLHTTTDHSCISCPPFRNTYELFNNYSNRMRHRSHIFIDLFRFLRIMSCKLCVALSRVFHKMCIVYICVNGRTRICRVFFFVTTVTGVCVCVCLMCVRMLVNFCARSYRMSNVACHSSVWRFLGNRAYGSLISLLLLLAFGFVEQTMQSQFAEFLSLSLSVCVYQYECQQERWSDSHSDSDCDCNYDTNNNNSTNKMLRTILVHL